MNLQVLVSTMNQTNYSLIEKMNIQSDAIIINQCDTTSYSQITKDDYSIKWFSFNEKGIGLSRNNALMRSEAEISLMADDDLIYVDNYQDIILNAFKENPDVDVFIFNVKNKKENNIFQNKKIKRLRLYNSMKFATYRIAFRTQKVKESNIYFSLLFGGNSKYSHGEDSLFIANCFKNGMNVYSHPATIAYIEPGPSTWFKGYTEKYFFDKGVLFKYISPKFWWLLVGYFVIKNIKLYKCNFKMSEIIKFMINGSKSV